MYHGTRVGITCTEICTPSIYNLFFFFNTFRYVRFLQKCPKGIFGFFQHTITIYRITFLGKKARGSGYVFLGGTFRTLRNIKDLHSYITRTFTKQKNFTQFGIFNHETLDLGSSSWYTIVCWLIKRPE